MQQWSVQASLSSQLLWTASSNNQASDNIRSYHNMDSEHCAFILPIHSFTFYVHLATSRTHNVINPQNRINSAHTIERRFSYKVGLGLIKLQLCWCEVFISKQLLYVNFIFLPPLTHPPDIDEVATKCTVLCHFHFCLYASVLLSHTSLFTVNGRLKKYNKKALLSQRRPRDAPNIWVPWKVARVLANAPGYFSWNL